MKVSKDKIQQLFTLKPSRAVDLIFSENKIQQIHQFYAGIQQNKKNNTQALRKTLQNNYEKMLYCSEILGQVRKYADAVKQVVKLIDDQMTSVTQIGARQFDDCTGIDKIQLLLRHHRFCDAMQQTYKANNISEADVYYLFYLRMQILKKMQKDMCVEKLSQQKLGEYYTCLYNFLFETQSNKKIKLRQRIEGSFSQFKRGSLLFLISKRVVPLKQVSSRLESQAIIYEILFQFKLTTLKNKHKLEEGPKYFQQYFNELQTIIRLYNQIKIQSSGNLREIFHSSTSEIKQQLSSIFIFRESNGQIVFKCDLYEKLIGSAEFQETISRFHQGISEGGKYQVQHPITFIKDLWHDYFINLIDLFVGQTNPLIRLPSLKKNSIHYENLPQELKIYLHDYSIQQSKNIIEEYKGKVQLLLKNVCPIIQKCTKAQIIKFTQKFNQKIEQISAECKGFIRQLDSQKCDIALRKYILLQILSEMLGFEMLHLNHKYNIRLNCQFMKQFKLDNIKHYWDIFYSQHNFDVSYLHSALVDFDCFFVGYLEAIQSQSIRNIISQVIKTVSLTILEYICSSSEQQRLKVAHTVDSLREKKEKITIFDKIVVPYLAKNIFQCSMRPVEIEKQFFQKHFIRQAKKEANKALQKAEEQPIDQFQIGQKQQKQEPVKPDLKRTLNLKNIGANITGFMKKKS